MTQAVRSPIDWIIFLTGSERRARLERTGRRAGAGAPAAHTHPPTCTHKCARLHSDGRLLGLRCHSAHTEDSATSRRQAFDSPYWKRSRHRWQCRRPPCICDPWGWRRVGDGEEKEKGRGEEGRWWKVRRQRQTVKNSTNNAPASVLFHCLPPPPPPPSTLPQATNNIWKWGFCVNFVQTSENDNKQKEARAICSVRQKHSTKVWSAVAQARGQSLFVPERERSWGGGMEGCQRGA